MKNKTYFPFRPALDVAILTAQSFRNKGHLLFQMLTKINIAISGKTSEPICRGTRILILRFSKIRQDQGLRGLTSYLKTCSVSTQQALGGHVHPNLTDLNTRVKRTALGIPKVLPVIWRKEIFSRPLLARYILSIFAIYRFFLYESPVKVKSIIAPFNGDIKELENLDKYIPAFFKALESNQAYKAWEVPTSIGSLFPILTQSPTSQRISPGSERLWSSHRISVVRAWITLNRDPNLKATWEGIKIIADHFKVPLFFELFSTIGRYVYPRKTTFAWAKPVTFLGKLGLKQEAAGKKRVFAMVDPITQWVLYPIHKFIFDNILNKLPMDGTFNQTKPLSRSLDWNVLYSLDLSSATDRLPISLQTKIIDFIWPGIGKHWETVLVERQYYNPDTSEGLTYAVGQPMGAYSSWAMLALTHHFIVQVAAWRACLLPRGVLFTQYAVLGDDIVIGNTAVKDQYLILLKYLGVECGLHKSLISPSGTALEFAKRTWHLGIDISPISIKDLVSSLVSVQSLVSFMNIHQVSLSNAMKIAGFGYRVLGGLNKPFFKLNCIVRNTILSCIFPSDPNFLSEVFGRSSLTRYTWEPLLGDSQVLKMFTELMYETLNDLLRFMYKPNPLIEKDVTLFSIKIKQSFAFRALSDRGKQTVDALANPVYASLTDPYEVFKEYIYVVREACLIKGLTNTQLANAKFGVDPFNVKLWKIWGKVLKTMSKVPKGNEDSKEVKFLESSLFLPILILKPLLRVLPQTMKFNFIKRYFWRSPILFISLMWYIGEWVALGSGLLLTLLSIGILLYPDFWLVVILPILTSLLTNYQISILMSALNIEWVEPISWLSYIFNWTYYSIKVIVNVPLIIFDTSCSIFIWWNTWVINFIHAVFGFFGVWFFVKAMSIIKLIYANTVSTMIMSSANGVISWIAIGLTQLLYQVIVDPIYSLSNDFSLARLILFVLPDPLGVWNGLITINLIPWVLLRDLVIGSSLINICNWLAIVTVTGWNLIIQDLSWFGLHLVFHISTPPTDIITFIFGPMDQRLGEIISGIQSLRSIFR